MLWDIRTRMKPALQVIDMIPNVHRTPALAALRRAVLEGRPATLRLSDEDRELAFHDAHMQLTSPIGARVLNGRSWFCGCAPFFPLEAADVVHLRTPGRWDVRK